MLYSLLAYLSLFLFLITTIFAINGDYKYYWFAALFVYIFSFLSGFSVGQLTVGLTFIFLALAIGYSFKWIKNRLQAVFTVGVGVFLAYLAVVYVDDAYLFFPFRLFPFF